MTIKEITLSSVFLILFLSVNLYSQKHPAKFGKIDSKAFESNLCPSDSNAHAYFIFDYGESRFTYPQTPVDVDASDNKGFVLEFTRHYRLKVCDTEGFDWADIEIPLYVRRAGEEESVVKFKAVTYNLENGKVVKTKFDKSDHIMEETAKNWHTYKAAMPNVREGSIIEVEYTIFSEFYFNLREWDFQCTVPVMHSEYHVSIPEYFNYNQSQRGYLSIDTEQESTSGKLRLTFVYKKEGGYEYYTKDFDYELKRYHYIVKDAPAFPIEKYLRTPENYLSRVAFELRSTQFPQATVNSYTTSWEEINKDLLDSYGFGNELNKTGHLKKDAELIAAKGLTGLELANETFRYFTQKMKWNKYRSIYSSKGLASTYKAGAGNVADLILNLVGLFRRVGVDAYPTLLSTQVNGIIYPVHPSVSSFDYVIAQVNIDGAVYLFDATDPLSEPNILPIRCLNDKGFVVSKYGGTWVDLRSKKYHLQEMKTIKITEDLSFEGVESLMLADYAAYREKKRIKNFNSIDEYQESLEKDNENLDVEEVTVKGIDEHTNRLTITYPFSQTNCVNNTGDMIFFSPAIDPFISSNPFKLEDRKYPVEFNYPYNIKQIYSYEIPEGYEVSELPKAYSAKLEANGASYRYSISQMGNKLNLAIMFTINKSMFLPKEYASLKVLYQSIIDKQKEPIVLKKL